RSASEGGLAFPGASACLSTVIAGLDPAIHGEVLRACAHRVSTLQQLEFIMSKLRLNFACGPYDRTQAFRDASIPVEGVELNYLNMQPAEIFWRQLQFQEFDASEMSLSNYTTLVASGKSPFIAIPVFPSRVFRHGYFFVNTDKGIESGADLKGKR